MLRQSSTVLIAFAVMLMTALPPHASAADQLTMVLSDDHEAHRWRKVTGRPDMSLRKVVIWTRHKGIGIGNTLGGLSRVMQDAMMEDRTILIRSIILEKFCQIFKCSLVPLKK